MTKVRKILTKFLLDICYSELGRYNTTPVHYLVRLLADRVTCSMIGYWHENVVCLSVCLSQRVFSQGSSPLLLLVSLPHKCKKKFCTLFIFK